MDRGEFTTGADIRCSEGNYLLIPNCDPPHPVRIDQSFVVGKHEITQGRRQAVMG
ncbi:MAG: hypothetical protein L6Q92_15010 [Phycisphaerae bacterium]|nr:hypothetical protein [Phycisphaerae bacterium]